MGNTTAVQFLSCQQLGPLLIIMGSMSSLKQRGFQVFTQLATWLQTLCCQPGQGEAGRSACGWGRGQCPVCTVSSSPVCSNDFAHCCQCKPSNCTAISYYLCESSPWRKPNPSEIHLQILSVCALSVQRYQNDICNHPKSSSVSTSLLSYVQY
jgi:hypothetical protein